MPELPTPDPSARIAELEQKIGDVVEQNIWLMGNMSRLQQLAAEMERDGVPVFNNDELQLLIEQGTGRITNLSDFQIVLG